MDGLVQYTIPVQGLHNGHHQFDFQVDGAFFKHFEASPVRHGDVQVQMSLDKRPDMLILEFDIEGTVRTNCDRCLANIDLPISGEQRLLVKYSEEEDTGTDEVIFIHPDTQSLKVANFVYEFVVLAIPMIKTYDCETEEEPRCDQTMLSYLDDEPKPESKGNNPFAEALKDLKNKERGQE